MEKLINWNDRYSVKIKEIDEQHKRLIELINNVYDSFEREEQAEIIGNVIGEMEKYALSHFNTEERYFAQFSYKNSANHIQEHRHFIEKVKDFQNELKKDQKVLSYKVLDFLRNWFNTHVLKTDKKYEFLLRENGLQ